MLSIQIITEELVVEHQVLVQLEQLPQEVVLAVLEQLIQ